MKWQSKLLQRCQNWFRPVVLLFFLGSIFLSHSTSAQQLLLPEVRVEGTRLADNRSSDLSSLREQIEQMLLGYAPSVDVSQIPRHPIRTVVQLRITEGDGYNFRGDLEMMMLRPIYGVESESVILFAAERGLEFQYTPSFQYHSLTSDLPESPLLRQIFYYATLGAMYYYDSFSVLGGAPFLQYLTAHRTEFERAWEDERRGGFGHNASYLSPRQHLTELKETWGNRFRELWYLYHREGLDSESSDEYGEVLHLFLEGLSAIQRENSTVHFAQFASDTKGGEMIQRLKTLSAPHQNALSQIIRSLFPTLGAQL